MANYPNSQKYRLDLTRPLTWQEGDENERFPTQWEEPRTYIQGQVTLYDDSYTVAPTAYGSLSYFQCILGNAGQTPGLPINSVAIPQPANVYWSRVVGGGDVNVQGPVGAQGAQGPGGTSGQTGPQGTIGSMGAQGAIGAQGSTPGPTGAQGPLGTQGNIGPAGMQGPSGAQGAGPQGAGGSAGAQGALGPTGPGGTGGVLNIDLGGIGIGLSGAGGSAGGTYWSKFGNQNNTYGSSTAKAWAPNRSYIEADRTQSLTMTQGSAEYTKVMLTVSDEVLVNTDSFKLQLWKWPGQTGYSYGAGGTVYEKTYTNTFGTYHGGDAIELFPLININPGADGSRYAWAFNLLNQNVAHTGSTGNFIFDLSAQQSIGGGTGDPGVAGPQGPAGAAGAAGSTGLDGPTGPSGAQGAYNTPKELDTVWGWNTTGETINGGFTRTLGFNNAIFNNTSYTGITGASGWYREWILDPGASGQKYLIQYDVSLMESGNNDSTFQANLEYNNYIASGGWQDVIGGQVDWDSQGATSVAEYETIGTQVIYTAGSTADNRIRVFMTNASAGGNNLVTNAKGTNISIIKLQGAVGHTGPAGAAGAQGAGAGTPGTAGTAGAAGPQGTAGAQGAAGAQGSQGPVGAQGSSASGMSITQRTIIHNTAGRASRPSAGTYYMAGNTAELTVARGFDCNMMDMTVQYPGVSGATVGIYMSTGILGDHVAAMSKVQDRLIKAWDTTAGSTFQFDVYVRCDTATTANNVDFALLHTECSDIIGYDPKKEFIAHSTFLGKATFSSVGVICQSFQVKANKDWVSPLIGVMMGGNGLVNSVPFDYSYQLSLLTPAPWRT